MLKFDIDGARKAGYTDVQIAEKLGKDAGFDVASARKSGYKDADIIGHLTGTRVAPAPAAPVEQTPVTPEVEDPGAMQAALIGAGRTFDRIKKGGQQVIYKITGNKEAAAKLKQEAEDNDQIYKKLSDLRPIATAVGEAAPTMVIPLGGTGTAATTIAKLATAGAAPELLSYGSVEERLKRGAAGAAGSVGFGYVAPKALGAATNAVKGTIRGLAGNVTPEALALADRAKAYGIDVNVAQLGDSKFLKTLASSLEQMPFTGAAKINTKQRQDFTRAVSKTFGEDTDKITPEVYAAARKRLGGQFEDLSMRNTLNLDRLTMDRLEAIASEANQFADDGTIKAVDNIIKRILNQSNAEAREIKGPFPGIPAIKTDILVPGAAYQSMDSSMSNIIKAGGEKAQYVKSVQKVIREAMDRSISAADKEAWDTARMQYKNLKAVRNIVAKSDAEGGIDPNQLLQSLMSTEAGKEAMAMGTRGQLGELAKIGKTFVRDAIPNSGTAQRAIAMGLIGGGGMAFGADPMTIVGMVAGSATAGRLMSKKLNSEKVIEGFKKTPMTLKDFLNLPPKIRTQMAGAGAGAVAARENMEE